jgi:hypothetical protein
MSYYSGNKVSASRKLQYNAQYNYIRQMLSSNPQENAFYYPTSQQQSNFMCNCHSDAVNDSIPTSTLLNESNAKRISNVIINARNRGKIQFGNGYLGNTQFINYLGRTPGQPGGSGSAPKNRLL